MGKVTYLPPPPGGDKSPKKLTIKEKQFCEAIVGGSSQSHAAIAVGWHPTNSTRTMQRQEIKEYIAYLRGLQRRRLNVTVDSLILELSTAFETAMKDVNPMAMVAATMAKAKLLGFLEVGQGDQGKTPKPNLIPTEMVEMTEEAWLAQYKPKLLQ